LNLHTVPRVRPPDKSQLQRVADPLRVETATRVLRSTLWSAQFLADDLDLIDLRDRLTPLVRDVDRILGEFDLA
jgi:hypothetical protein